MKTKKQIEKGCGIIFGSHEYSDMNPRPCGYFDGKEIRLCEDCRAKRNTLKEVCEEIKLLQKQLIKESASYIVCEKLLKKIKGEGE